MKATLVLIVSLFNTHAHAVCEDDLRNRDYRRSPEYGQAKQGMVDYKLINQLLMALQSAVVKQHPLSPGFSAELAPARRSDSPVGGVRIRGAVAWPSHPLRGHEIVLEVQRERLAFVAELHDLTTGQIYEALMDADGFSSLFPFQQPAGRGLLLSLTKGIELNFAKFKAIP